MMKFNIHNNLSEDLILSCKEFKQLFGFNKEREKKIDNLFKVADKFKKIGCKTMFVFGSFTTSTAESNDIDVCFDISIIDRKTVEKNYSMLDRYERKRYKEYLLVHVILKEKSDDEIIEWLKQDRNYNKRGIIEISLKDLSVYDKE